MSLSELKTFLVVNLSRSFIVKRAFQVDGCDIRSSSARAVVHNCLMTTLLDPTLRA
jgi:hypothetical protein